MADIKSMYPLTYTYHIVLEDDAKPIRQILCRLRSAMKDLVKGEVSKLLDIDIMYPVAYSKLPKPRHSNSSTQTSSIQLQIVCGWV